MRASTVAKAKTKPSKTSKAPSKPAKESAQKAAASNKKPAAPAKKPVAAAAKAPAAKPAPSKPSTAAKASAPAAKPVPAKAATAAKGTPAPPAAKTAPAKKPGAAAAPAKPAAPAKSTPPSVAESPDKKPAGPKGITIVNQKPMRKPKPKPKLQMPIAEPLLKPGGKWKPLIPSGPKAPPTQTGFAPFETEDDGKPVKAKLPKRELDRYKDILKRKRSELVGDIATMEEEALRQNSGSLSSLPQHMAEQGSDASEQSLSLDLAQVDRNLIREIDEALHRIEAGTYGICELTHKPISADRLAELPWARHSIEAARELERRSYRS